MFSRRKHKGPFDCFDLKNRPMGLPLIWTDSAGSFQSQNVSPGITCKNIWWEKLSVGWVRNWWQIMPNISKLSHESQNIPNKCEKVILKMTYHCEIFKMWFLTPNPGLYVQYKNKLKPCALFATNCKYNPPIFSTSSNILHMLHGDTFCCKIPKNHNLNFSLPKTTEQFHCNNTRPTWPESPSKIMKIMYWHLWSNIVHFQDIAQNRTLHPKVWNFGI